jgi:glycosyltransferase involved in cell wall biosynthesis
MSADAPQVEVHLRVLHVIPSLGPARGGPSVALPIMARGLTRCGVEIHVAATDDNGSDRLSIPLNQAVVGDGVAVWYFPRQARTYTFSWPLTRWLVRHVSDYDLVHIHALFSYPSVSAAWCAQRAGVPYVVRPLGTLNRWGMTRRRPWLKRLSFALVERRILTGAAAVQYTSEQECEEARELGVQAHAVVIPLGIELNEHENLPSPDKFLCRHPSLAERTIILFMSRLDPKKGLDLLLPAFAQLRTTHPDTALVIAGSGPRNFIDSLQNQVQNLSLADNVLMTGFLSGEDKLAALAASDLFVLPSYSENFGIAPVEAMAAGLPVILSDRVGIAKEVQDAEAGFVVSCDASAVAEALHCLVSNADLRRRLGDNARSLAGDRFSSDAAAHRLVDLYRSVLSGTQELPA